MIKTKRLILKPFHKQDAEAVFAYTNAQTVHCFADTKLDSVETTGKDIR